MFNTALVFQRGVCGTDLKDSIMMWLLCILMRAADNDILSKTLHRGCVCADSVGRAAAPWLGLRGGARLQELGTLALESIRRTDGI